MDPKNSDKFRKISIVKKTNRPKAKAISPVKNRKTRQNKKNLTKKSRNYLKVGKWISTKSFVNSRIYYENTVKDSSIFLS
jgi:hypothetical protein